MASNQETLVTVFGGSGFLGRNVVRALAKRDYRIRVAVRRPERASDKDTLGYIPNARVLCFPVNLYASRQSLPPPGWMRRKRPPPSDHLRGFSLSFAFLTAASLSDMLVSLLLDSPSTNKSTNISAECHRTIPGAAVQTPKFF